MTNPKQALTVRVRAEGGGDAFTEFPGYVEALEFIRRLPESSNGTFEITNKAGRVSMFRKAGRHLIRQPSPR